MLLQLVSSEQQVRMISEMLESYEREIQSLEGSINEAEEDLDNTRWRSRVDGCSMHQTAGLTHISLAAALSSNAS